MLSLKKITEENKATVCLLVLALLIAPAQTFAGDSLAYTQSPTGTLTPTVSLEKTTTQKTTSITQNLPNPNLPLADTLSAPTPVTPEEKLQQLITDRNADGKITAVEVVDAFKETADAIKTHTRNGTYEPKYDIDSNGTVNSADGMHVNQFVEQARQNPYGTNFSISQQEKFRFKMFFAADQNQDLSLTAFEALEGLKAARDRSVKALNQGLPYDVANDTNGDGYVTGIDVINYVNEINILRYTPYSSLLPLSQAEKQKMKIFDKLDANRDFILTAEEIWKNFKKSAEDIINALNQRAPYNAANDINGDGFITGFDALILINELNIFDPYKTYLPLSQTEKQLYKIIILIDEDRNGSLSAYEGTTVLKSAAHRIIDHLNRGLAYSLSFDINGDGYVTGIDALIVINQFNLVLSSPYGNNLPLIAEERQMVKILTMLDANGDSALSASEVMSQLSKKAQEIINALNAKLPYHQSLDTNGDGILNAFDALILINLKNLIAGGGNVHTANLPMSSEEKTNLKIILILDTDGNNTLSASEVFNGMRNIRNAVDAAIRTESYDKLYDLNGDGIINALDRAILTAKINSLRQDVYKADIPMTEAERKTLTAFFAVDQNGDLTMTLTERLSALSSVAARVNNPARYDSRYDLNRDGKISIDEYLVFVNIYAGRGI